MYALSTGKNFFHTLISTYVVHSEYLQSSRSSPYFLTALVFANAVSRVGLRPNKIGHPVGRDKRLKPVPELTACGISTGYKTCETVCAL